MPTGNRVVVEYVPEAVLADAKVRAKGPVIMLVADGVQDNVPAVVAVPKVNKLVADVLISPEVIVKVPDILRGMLNVTPVALVLLTVKFVNFAVAAVVKFWYIPLPPIVCAFVDGVTRPLKTLDKKMVLEAVMFAFALAVILPFM